ncbi:MAG: radical SAM protein [Desulfomonile tiedjei]|nr:radical SAM protein [Desulfomonile tiedjei]
MSFLFINVNHDVGFESSESIPISLGYILAGLKAAGWDGVILDDLRDRPLSLGTLEKWIHRMNPSLVGFTAYRSTISRIRFLCRYIKSRHRNILVVLGGPQIVAMPPRGLEELGDMDVLVRGEGEAVMPALARALAAGDPLDSVAGITCRENGRITETEDAPLVADLDTYPSPYLTNLLNLEGKNTAILLSSRGCRHMCRFCITPHICRGKIRFHSVDRVVAEMEHLAKRGIERFWFADPNFTDDEERTVRLLDQKIERGIETPFWCQTRADLVTAALLEKLREAGADTIAFGLESGSPGVLAKTGKGIQLEQVRTHVAKAQSLGMETELFSIFGLPGETVEEARQTLEFVRSLGIPILSNSGSQQMQLYFGSAYNKQPDRYGIRPIPRYRPSFLSIGDDFETDSMSREGLRMVRNLWALANEQMEQDVYYKQRIFEVIDFLLENREDLKEEPTYYAYGALATAAIEEFGLLVEFLDGFASVQPDDGSTVNELISSLTFFQETDEPAGPTDRIIFDSRSWIDEVPFTGISGKYWDVLLGRGLLLAEFEQGLVGSRPGEDTKFSFVFPGDYFQEELRNKEVEVAAKIHKVFRTVELTTVDEVRNLDIRNGYGVLDLDQLREQNEILYYLALRDADPAELLNKPSHFLMLIYRLAKLGKREKVKGLAAFLAGKPTALNAFADTLVGSGKCGWALEYYQAISDSLPSSVLKRVRCLLSMGEPNRAARLLDTIQETPDLEFQETLLDCLKAARPDSSRIPSLEKNILNLRVNAAVSRETLARPGQVSIGPVVHGWSAETTSSES